MYRQKFDSVVEIKMKRRNLLSSQTPRFLNARPSQNDRFFYRNPREKSVDFVSSLLHHHYPDHSATIRYAHLSVTLVYRQSCRLMILLRWDRGWNHPQLDNCTQEPDGLKVPLRLLISCGWSCLWKLKYLSPPRQSVSKKRAQSF